MSGMKQSAVVVAVSAVLAARGACHRAGRQGRSPRGPIALYVRNTAFFDAVVSSLPATGNDSRTWIGTVPGHSDRELTVATTARRLGGLLAVYQHATGSRYSWTSPAVMVVASQRACLDIFANPVGNLDRSPLHVMREPIVSGDGKSARARSPLGERAVRASSRACARRRAAAASGSGAPLPLFPFPEVGP